MTTSSISTSTPPGVGDRMSVLHPLVLSNGVRLLVVWVLCCDVIVTAVEADVTRRRQQADVFVGLSCVLTLFYTCEFILKLYVAGTAFWRQPGGCLYCLSCRFWLVGFISCLQLLIVRWSRDHFSYPIMLQSMNIDQASLGYGLIN